MNNSVPWLILLVLYTIFQGDSSGLVVTSAHWRRGFGVWSVGSLSKKTTSWFGTTRATPHQLMAFIQCEETTKSECKKSSSNDVEVAPDVTQEELIETTSSTAGGAIEISAAIELPFPKSVAYDAFSDLSRQSTYSPWLKSVEYIEGERHTVGSKTRWKMSYLGLRFTWNSVSTLQDRKNGIIEWESITGLQNNGRVTFHEIADDRTHMNMTMSFTVPRFAARVIGPKKLASVVEKRILESTVRNFRQIVVENDWKVLQQQQQQQTSESLMMNVNLKSTVPSNHEEL